MRIDSRFICKIRATYCEWDADKFDLNLSLNRLIFLKLESASNSAWTTSVKSIKCQIAISPKAQCAMCRESIRYA